MNGTIPNDRNEFAKIESINKYLKKAKSPSTLKNWKYSLYDFFEFVKIHPDDFIKLEKTKIEDLIESYVDHLKDRVKQNQVNPNSIITMVYPLKKFLIFNKVEGMFEPWVRIKAGFPPKKRSADVKYSEIELLKMYNIANFREKALLGLLMSGMRKGAIKDLKFKDIKPIEDWAAIRVYADTIEEYHAFVTPQGYQSIIDYRDYRNRNGEQVTENSPLIRYDFRPECAGEWTDIHGRKHSPEPIHTDGGVAEIVINLARKAGVLTNSHDPKTRHKIMTCHGFRKCFNTVCKTSGMDSERVEMLMGHANSSLSGHYWRLPTDESEMSPQEQRLFQTIKKEFRRCIPELTIGESEMLKIKNQQLEETVDEQMKEKEFQIISLQKQLSKVKDNPFIGMSQGDVEGYVQMYQDWKNLKNELQEPHIPK
jgi:site-specific recombinase XerD